MIKTTVVRYEGGLGCHWVDFEADVQTVRRMLHSLDNNIRTIMHFGPDNKNVEMVDLKTGYKYILFHQRPQRGNVSMFVSNTK